MPGNDGGWVSVTGPSAHKLVSLPLAMTGPVGSPVGDPPGGSSDTASAASGVRWPARSGGMVRRIGWPGWMRPSEREPPTVLLPLLRFTPGSCSLSRACLTSLARVEVALPRSAAGAGNSLKRSQKKPRTSGRATTVS